MNEVTKTMLHIHTTQGDQFGFHFEWAGGESTRVRVVETQTGQDIDTFHFMEPPTLNEVEARCADELPYVV